MSVGRIAAAEELVTIERPSKWQVRASALWITATIAAIAVTTAAFFPNSFSEATRASILSFVAASSNQRRALEPRLSGGSAWAPYCTEPCPGTSPVISSTLTRLRDAAAEPDGRVAGVTYLLAGRPREALVALRAAAAANDPLLWNDYAAANYAAALRYESPQLLAEALAAADAALSISPDLPEALFNRALIIERLGLRDDARSAWNRYLLHETNAAWLAEGREHLNALAPVESYRDALIRNYDRLIADPNAAIALVRSNPEAARTQAFAEVLGRWAENRGDATRDLALARLIASELARINGDLMLARTVAAIEKTSGDARTELVSAHRDYSTGVKTYWRNEGGAAEPVLNRAIAALARNDSPLQFLARFYAANAVFDQGRRNEACEALERLLPDVPTEYPATRAHVLSQLGACRFARARWGDAMTILAESAAIFDRLGEISNASAVRRLIASIYDRTGDRDRAWQVRMTALKGIGRESNLRLEKAIGTIVHEAIQRRNWPVALAFLNIEADIARRIGDDVHLAESLALRAAVRYEMKDERGARADLASARTATIRVKDEGHREYLAHEQDIVDARLASPKDAVTLYTAAIDFQALRGDRMNLPNLYLERARAFRRGEDFDAAASDLARGIAELERSRESLPQGEGRWGAFYAAGELFEEAVDLALQQDRIDYAFSVAETGRARSLLESYGRASTTDRLPPEPGTLIVEYAALPSGLAIFTVDAGGVRAQRIPVDRAVLRNEVDAFLRALQNDDAAAKQAGATLFRRLIEPIESHLAGASSVIFVPDAATSSIPFAALVDGEGRYLIETHTVVVTPSAAVFAAAQTRRAGTLRPETAMIVSHGAATDTASALSFVGQEAAQIAGAYPTSIEASDAGAMREHAAAADVIHFAGHAVGDASGLEPASLILRDGGKDSRFGVSEIAALPLRRASTVVLAGCSTARGQIRGLEGVISVAHGFLTAGAPSVIATLWKIDDQTAASVFPRLHSALAQGVPPAEALRAIQLECIRRRDVPPSLWAALQALGS